VIKKPRGRRDHSPRWAAEPEEIIIVNIGCNDKIIITIIINRSTNI
jgi:hypothetical protein